MAQYMGQRPKTQCLQTVSQNEFRSGAKGFLLSGMSDSLEGGEWLMIIQRKCRRCGESFSAKDRKQVYCCNFCKQTAETERKIKKIKGDKK